MTIRTVVRAAARRAVPRTLRNLLRSPSRTAAWLTNEAAYLLGRRPTVAVRTDWVVASHPVSRTAFAAFARDEELVAELDAFVARCTPGMTLLDAGANFGLFCLAALRYGGPGARAVAIDPSAASNRVLRANLELAGAGDRVRVIEAAAGADDGVLPMLPTGPAGDHYFVAAPGARAGAADGPRPDATIVPKYSLPTIVSRTGWPPSHVKIDVEGYEYEVVEGAAEYLGRERPVVFLELHCRMLRQRGRDPGEVLNLLAACGYNRLEYRGRAIEPRDALDLDIARLACLPGGA